jgi:hypothetical protein
MALRAPLVVNATYGYQEEITSADAVSLPGGATAGANIAMGGNKVTGLGAATANGDAASYGQSGLSLAGLTLTAALAMGGFLINNLGTPLVATDAATKGYVDSVAQGLSWHMPVRAVATTNVTSLSGPQTVDTVALIATNRVLLTAQTTATENGIWVVNAGAWTRPTDYPVGFASASTAVFVSEGSVTYADTAWTCITDAPVDVVDTNPTAWALFATTATSTASNGLVKVGNDFRVKPGDGIEVVSNSASTNVALDATAPGLQFTGVAGTGKLQVKVLSTGGLEVLSTGVDIKVDGTTAGNPTVATGVNGLRVIGVPLNFNINNAATSSNVTAANLNTLTAGSTSDASSLHKHGSVGRVADTYTALNALANGDPVFQSATADEVDKANTTPDLKSFVLGVAEGAISGGGAGTIVCSGPAVGVLAGATPGIPYYLQPGGGLGVSVPPNGGGHRVIQCGVAKSATDLWVHVRDYGKKA